MHELIVASTGATETVHTAWDWLWADGNGPLAKAVKIATIILIALIVRFAAKRVIRTFVNRIVTGAKKRQRVEDTQALLASPVSSARVVQRTRTLGTVLNNVVGVVVVIIALLSILTTVAPTITGAFSLITAAVGAGLGFGAQNLVKDVLTGLFMVADDQLGVGDIVETDLATGIVEAVGIRITQIRDVNGVLWYVRNGELTRVGNRSQGWSRAIVDVTVPKTIDVEAVQQRLLAAARTALADPEWRHVVSDVPELWGLESVTADGIVLRLVVRTNANARDDVAWALRTHLREALEDAGLEPSSITSARVDEFEYAGALRGVRPPRTSPTPTQRRRKPRAQPSVEAAPPEKPPTAPRTGTRGATGRTGPKASEDGLDGG